MKDTKNGYGYNYLVWGEFDGLKFKFTPTRKEFLDEEESDSRYELHLLRIYSRKINPKEAKDFINGVDLPPLLVLTEIKLNEELYKFSREIPNGQILSNAEKQIRESLDSFLEDHKSNTKYFLFNSLGYSEFVIIFRTNNFQNVASILSILRSQPYHSSSSKTAIHIIQSTHSICGAHLGMLDSRLEGENDVSIRVTFQKMDDFPTIEQQIIAGLPKLGKSEVSIKTLPGKYDLVINLKNYPINAVVNLFYPVSDAPTQQLFFPKSKDYIDSVGDTNTQWLLDVKDPVGELLEVCQTTDPDFKNRHLHLKVENKDPEKDPTTFDLLIDQMIHQYDKYAFDKGADPLIIYELREIIQKYHEQVKEDEKVINGKQFENIIEHNEKSLKGINLILGLLKTRLQAFHFFSDFYSSDSGFVKSAAKIFVVYMTVIEEIENSINDLYTYNLNFFTAIDNQDRVEAYDLFPDTTSRIIPIVLGASSFFDISYNLQLLFHEISHFIHSPDRALRNEMFTEMVCNTISEWIIHTILGGNNVTTTELSAFDEENLSELITSLKNEFMGELWKNKNTNENSLSIGKFPEVLKDRIHSKYSFIDESLNKLFNELELNVNTFSSACSKINMWGKKQEKSSFQNILPNDIELIVKDLFYKIELGEDLQSIHELWKFMYENMKIDDEFIGLKSYFDQINGSFEKVIRNVSTRKNDLEKCWAEFVENHISKAILNVKVDGNSNSIKLHMWSRLAYSHLNENHYENHKAIADQIVKTFNSPEFIEKINNAIDNQTKIFREATADYSMCRLLDLKWDQYTSMIDRFKNKASNSYTKSGLEELEIRKQILAQTNFYKNDAKNDTYIDIGDIAIGMSFSCVAEYLNKASKKADFATKIIKGKSLSLIKEYFKEIDGLHVEPDNDFIPEIKLIEGLWDIGMRLFFKEDQNDAKK